MARDGQTYSELAAEKIERWISQFELRDQDDVKLLLSVMRNVSADEFHDDMTNLLQSRVRVDPAPVGLFVEMERGHWKGQANRLFSEPLRKHLRAYGSSPLGVGPRRTVDPEVGSEGLIWQIATEAVRLNRRRATIHPGPDTIRSRKIRRFILVTDFIGSGNRTSRYLDAAWRVRSVKSWWSARRSRGMSFEVISYSSTEAGLRKVKGHPTRPSVHIVEGCTTIDQAFEIPRVRRRIQDLCRRYGSFDSNVDPLGYEGTGALITFSHGMPNNAPAMLHKGCELKSRQWFPLYRERITSGVRAGIEAVTKKEEALQLDLRRVMNQKIIDSPRVSSAPASLRDAVHVLLALDRAPRTAAALSARTGLSIERVQDAVTRIRGYGWVDGEDRIAVKGRRELGRLSASVQEKVSFEPETLYIPRSLRAPREV